MLDVTCSECGSSFEPSLGRGRPRKFCTDCRPVRVDLRRRKRPVTFLESVECVDCGVVFEKRRSDQRFCSERCRYRQRDRKRMFPCAVCGEPMHRGRSVRDAGEACHQHCRIEQAGHGVSRYNKHGCRCDICREASSAAVKSWTQEHNYWSRPDVVSRRRARRGTPEARNKEHQRWRRYYSENRDEIITASNAKSARRKGAPTVPFTRDQLEARLSMFGGCWMCGADLGKFHIDHVKPLARGGWHCLSNLRPACPTCNISKGAKWPLTASETLGDSRQG